jgi:hypothetical protein
MKAFSLTEGRVAPTLVRFALPFMLSSLLQSLYGAADLFVVGQYAGAAAVSADGHYAEFLDAIRGEGVVYSDTNSRCFSDVDASIPIMESVLVGVMSQRVPGRLAWNSRQQKFDNADANALMRPFIRKGFEF